MKDKKIFVAVMLMGFFYQGQRNPAQEPKISTKGGRSIC